MRALVIGGTRFVGAAIVEELVRRGAEVTIFSRGETNPGMFQELDHVRGDRATDLARLGERRFDAVIDSCGYTPAQVDPAAALAAGQGAFYVFVSTASVYALDASVERVGEDHRLLSAGDAGDAGARYGIDKARCEAALAAALGERFAILRPGLVVGPRDYTDRFLYWVWRLAEGGEVLVPGDGADPLQVIDARDLARFAVRLAEEERSGVYNVTGPPEPATFGDLVAAASAGAQVEPVWAGAAFLAEHEVSPWQEMPCWLPRDHDQAAILRLDARRAVTAGLGCRPWAETVADARAWMESVGRAPPRGAGIDRHRERELLADLRRR